MDAIGNKERAYDFSVSDFAKLVKTNSFVDKSLLIKDIFRGSSRILITAPPCFGKSTSIDMIKRFLEIQMDNAGIPKLVHTTENYSLFKDNNLDIYKEKQFFKEHFGTYPVIHIDFGPLSGARDFAHMLDIFRTVIQKSFNQHSYLLNTDNPTIGSCWFDFDFKKHVSNQLLKDIDAEDLMCSFEYLSKILFRYFDKQVFVLIDNCDAFIKRVLLRRGNNPDTEKIVYFIKTTIDNLLNKNTCVEQVLLTAVVPVTGDAFPFDGCHTESCSFMSNHPFSKFFYLNDVELNNLLHKHSRCEKKLENLRSKIGKSDSDYLGEERSFRHNMWSVLQCVYKTNLQPYRCSSSYIKTFEPLFKNLHIKYKLALLLLNHEVTLDISQTLSATDILELNKTIISGKVEDAPSSVADAMFLLFYHFGYFSANNVLDDGFVCLIFSNYYIKYKVASAFVETAWNYDGKQEVISNVLLIIESIRHGNLHPDTFIAFGETVNSLYDTNLTYPFSEQRNTLFFDHKLSGILCGLYIILVSQPRYIRTLFFSSGQHPYCSTILVKNKTQVNIYITAKEVDSAPSAETVREAAETALYNIIHLRNDNLIFIEDDSCLNVIIAVGYKRGSTGFSVAYSYYFLDGSNQCDYRCLTFGF